MTGANAVIQEHCKDKIFREMRGFADQVMEEFEGALRDMGKEPAEDGFDDRAGVG